MKERYSPEEMEKGKNGVFHRISSGFMKEEHTKKQTVKERSNRGSANLLSQCPDSLKDPDFRIGVMKQGIDETKGKGYLSPLCLNQYHSHKQTYAYSFALQ